MIDPAVQAVLNTLHVQYSVQTGESNAFAFDLLKTTVGNSDEPNVFLSPLSVGMALSMTANGAAGTTLDQMRKALHWEGSPMAEINEYSRLLCSALPDADASSELALANAVWYKREYSVEQAFVGMCRDYYNAGVTAADFSKPAVLLKEINDWCARNTRGKIPKVLDAVSPDAIMFLANAVYFKGVWSDAFDPKATRKQIFRSVNEDQTVDMMQNRKGNKFLYHIDDLYSSVELPYGNGAFAMKILLPAEGKTAGELVEYLADCGDQGDGESLCPVNIALPRFKLETGYDLEKKILPGMGMIDAFKGDRADFSGINPARDLFIAFVKHKAFIEVNEEGSEAAAVTVVGIEVTSVGPESRPPVEFVADRPFVFLIKERTTGTVMFIGKVGKI